VKRSQFAWAIVASQPRSAADKAHQYRPVDGNRLHREVCISSGWTGTWRWSRDREHVAFIIVHTESEHSVLSYHVRIG